MMQATKTVASRVNKIVKTVYPYGDAFNNKLKTTRKLKYMINGYDFGDQQYDAWATEVKKKLTDEKIEAIDVKFEWCDSWLGAYRALIVTLPLQQA